MSVDSVNSSASTAYVTNRENIASTPDQNTQSGAAVQNLIEDTIEISPEAQKITDLGSFAKSEKSTPLRMGESYIDRNTLDARIAEADLRGQWGLEKARFDHQRDDKHHAILNKLHQEYGGTFSGTVIPNDFSKPITTTSGAPHPDADAIRSFLQDHKSEWDQLMGLGQEKFPSFEDWAAQQG